jgi:hypothetical protein
VIQSSTHPDCCDIFRQVSITLKVVAGPVISVAITPIYVTAIRAAFTAVLPDTAATARLSWSVEAAASAGGGVAPPPLTDPAAFLAGTSGRSFVVRLDTPAALFLLTGPAAAAAGYRVVLRVSSGGNGAGSAALPIALPVPPSGGTCIVQPTLGAALQARFEVRCSGWSADNLPLAYAFSSRPTGAAGSAAAQNLTDPGLSWSPKSSTVFTGMYLPAGNYTLAAAVFDAVGAQALMDAEGGTVRAVIDRASNASNGAADAAAVGRLVDRLALSGAVGPALSVIDAVGDTVNSAVPAVTVISGTRRGGGRGRRLLGSSAAYRRAVRRLLLQKLSGISGGGGTTTATAPAIIRASRRASAVPSEIGAGSPEDGIAALIASLQAADILALRAAPTLPDAAKLALSILEASSTSFSPSRTFPIDVADTLLGAVGKYALGMVEGEQPMIYLTNASSRSVALYAVRGGPLVSVAGAAAGWPATVVSNNPIARRVGISSPPPAGISVVRLTSQYGQPDTTADGVGAADPGAPLADVVGILVTPPSASATAGVGSWRCPVDRPGCVEATVFVLWSGGVLPEEAKYECVRWTSGEWNTSGCSVSGIESSTQLAVSNKSSSIAPVGVTAKCICNSDGVISVSATALANPPNDRLSPDFVVELCSYQSGGAAAVVGAVGAALCAFLAALVLSAQYRILSHIDPVGTKRLPSSRKTQDRITNLIRAQDRDMSKSMASTFFEQRPFMIHRRRSKSCRRRPFLSGMEEALPEKRVAEAAAEDGIPVLEISDNLRADSRQSTSSSNGAGSHSDRITVSADLVYLSASGSASPMPVDSNGTDVLAFNIPPSANEKKLPVPFMRTLRPSPILGSFRQAVNSDSPAPGADDASGPEFAASTKRLVQEAIPLPPWLVSPLMSEPLHSPSPLPLSQKSGNDGEKVWQQLPNPASVDQRSHLPELQLPLPSPAYEFWDTDTGLWQSAGSVARGAVAPQDDVKRPAAERLRGAEKELLSSVSDSSRQLGRGGPPCDVQAIPADAAWVCLPVENLHSLTRIFNQGNQHGTQDNAAILQPVTGAPSLWQDVQPVQLVAPTDLSTLESRPASVVRDSDDGSRPLKGSVDHRASDAYILRWPAVPAALVTPSGSFRGQEPESLNPQASQAGEARSAAGYAEQSLSQSREIGRSTVFHTRESCSPGV